jgi:acetyl esterase
VRPEDRDRIGTPRLSQPGPVGPGLLDQPSPPGRRVRAEGGAGDARRTAAASRGGAGKKVLRWGADVAVQASLVVTPRLAALLTRRAFADGDLEFAQQLEKYALPGVAAVNDERYGDEDDMLLDVFRPASAAGRLPLVLWVHGGGWVGGSRAALTGYLKLIASHGYVVAGPDYSLAPEHHYPTPPRQMMQALTYLQVNAARYQIDPDRIVIGGSSAGAQIAAQLGALVTTPGYAAAVGVTPAITAAQLRGLVLACGRYDLGLASQASTAADRRFMKTILSAYSGTRRYRRAPAFATFSVANYITPAFPPALITVGNGDPLRPHSELLADRLRVQGVEPDTLFFPAHQPRLGHEYQFDLDTAEGQLFLNRMLTFLQQRLKPTPGGAQARSR